MGLLSYIEIGPLALRSPTIPRYPYTQMDRFQRLLSDRRSSTKSHGERAGSEQIAEQEVYCGP